MAIWGGIEAGGTKFVCAVGTGSGDIKAEEHFPTTTPGETLARVIQFFEDQQKQLGPLTAIGIGSFGPVNLDVNSSMFGYVTNTPKTGWVNTEFYGVIQRTFDIPVGFDTDVNAAALGEYTWGAAQGLDTFLYLTIGTGIGGGAMVNGQLLHGLMHPEMGHLRIPHDFAGDPYRGICPYHNDCLEGLASGPALEHRWGKKAEYIPVDHPAWELEASYLALGLVNLMCTFSPQRIIMGGGVMQQKQLFPGIHKKVKELLGGYLSSPIFSRENTGIENYIVPPGLGKRSGILGAIALARRVRQI